ncbi:MAG: peptidoglycan editing factor PgeF [Pseudomonadota bacterium]|nr:peptidoglycan editing factor PgeF [Pseudomonadota bacterium]
MEWIEPDWPAPTRVRAFCTTRRGGASAGPFSSMNLADHVGDDPAAVARNRAILRDRLGLPAEPHWLSQVHGCAVARTEVDERGCEADAVLAFRSGEVCAVLTADCLPLLLCDRAGTRVGAVHAGWRGLVDGVIEAAVERLETPPDELLCWLGPAIGPGAFEVGDEVRERFLTQGRAEAAAAFRPSDNGRWLADLFALAIGRLRALGVEQVWGGGLCTHSDGERFFSYRRDGITGRMASLIWIGPATDR